MVLILLQGCTYKLNFRHDLNITKHQDLNIQGKIIKNKLSTKPYYLVLYKLEKDKKLLVDFSTHYIDNIFRFHVIPGEYILYCIQEPETLTKIKNAFIFESEKIYIDENTKEININMNIPLKKIIKFNNLISSINHKSIFDSIAYGKEVKFSDPLFNKKNIQTGLWSPEDFLIEVGGGIYSFNKLDPSKTPILFIHGISGSPKDFFSIVNNLDKNKFQILFYYYPSGSNLNNTIEILKFKFDKLMYKYNYKKLIVIAHSMGGLIGRGFINNYYKKIKIPIFITLSTPWNGQKFAKLGGVNVGKFVASFGNMYPQSAFQKKLFLIDPSEDTKHYLFFGYRGKKSIILENSNDGIISLSSFLYNPIQDKAHKIIGLNLNHREILHDKVTIEKIKKIISIE